MENKENNQSRSTKFNQLKELINSMSCSEIFTHLENTQYKQSEADMSLYISEIVKKGCNSEEVIPLLLKQLTFNEPFYRKEALNYLNKIGGKNSRNIFIETIKNDNDEDVRQSALINLSDLFRSKRDLEILELAYDIYNNPTTGVSMKFAAAAAMMYQLGIEHDKDGRPAWWDADEEDLNHPLLQEALSETKILLKDKT